MWFSLLAARSGVYIRVTYSIDTPVPWFDPFHELNITLVVTSRNTTLGGYMVCNLVCQVHLMHDCRTRTVMVTYSNVAYHDAGNALDFKPRYCRSHRFLFRLCFDCFNFNCHLLFIEFYGRVLYVSFYVSFPVFVLKKLTDFATDLNIKIWSCRVVGIYSACCYLSDDIPFSVGVHFGRQGCDKQM